MKAYVHGTGCWLLGDCIWLICRLGTSYDIAVEEVKAGLPVSLHRLLLSLAWGIGVMENITVSMEALAMSCHCVAYTPLPLSVMDTSNRTED